MLPFELRCTEKSFDIFLTLSHVLDFAVQRHKEIERRMTIRDKCALKQGWPSE